MKKILTCGMLFILSFTAQASTSRTFCKGSTFADDGMVYDGIHFNVSFDSNRGTFDLEADGKNEKFEFDIGNRFHEVPFVGEFERNSKNRIISARMSGAHLPGSRSIDVSLDLRRPQSQAKLVFERSDGSSLRTLLSCQTSLAPVCRTVRKCRNHCHPMVGCEPICETQTVCEPQEFD